MTVCIAGCQYMPSIEYFAHWVHHRLLTIEGYEHFQKRTWRNKTAILSPDSPLELSVPLKKGKNDHKQIRSVEIAYDEPWHRIHFQSLKTIYSKTPFFMEMEDDIRKILYSQPVYLWDLNYTLIEYFLQFLPEDLKFDISGDYIKTYPDSVVDLRNGVAGGRLNLSIESIPVYLQVQRLNKPFLPNLSILDVLCHLGPGTATYLNEFANKIYYPS